MAHRPAGGAEIPPCQREPELVRALARGELSEGLVQHAEACPACGEVLSVAQQLQHLERTLEEPLESAASLWWRLNLRIRRQKMHRATLPLVWMSRICGATIVAAAIFALWQVFRHTTASDVLVVGLASLATVAVPTLIVLWRWSQS